MGNAESRTDTRLADAYLDGRDAGALEEAIRRYEPLVLGVCRRRLGDPQDIRDVGQAAFLALAAQPRPPRPTGPWLHRAACRIAARVMKEKAMGEKGAPIGLIDREIDRLPDRYRQALILRFLAGRSEEETATSLKKPVGTVTRWLDRGKELLRRRFDPAPTPEALEEILTNAPAAAAERNFAAWTAKGAVAAAAGLSEAGGFVSARAMALSEEASRMTLPSRLAFGALAACLTGLLLVGFILLSPAASTLDAPRTADRVEPVPPASIPPPDAAETAETPEEKKVEEVAVVPPPPAELPTLSFESADGKIEGTHLTYVANVDCITCWAHVEGRVTWSFTSPASGKFAVVVTNVHGNGPSKFVVTVGDQKTAGAILERGADPDWTNYVDDVLDAVELVKGRPYPVSVQVTFMPNGCPWNFRRVALYPLTPDLEKEIAQMKEKVSAVSLPGAAAARNQAPTPVEELGPNAVVLAARTAKIEGTHLTYVPNVDCMACWENCDARLAWSFDPPASGKYAVVATLVHGNGPSEYAVTIGESKLIGKIPHRRGDPGWFEYVDDALGVVELVKGRTYTASVQVTSMPHGRPMNLRRITLRPAP
jgi:DNA-directed RNA polymerase specialized sigma24 family protein